MSCTFWSETGDENNANLVSELGYVAGESQVIDVFEPISVPELPAIEESVASADDMSDESSMTMYYTENEVLMVAKLLYRECRGIASDTEKACVAWTVCNRVDSDEFDCSTITEALLYPNAFAYRENTPVWDELYELAEDVLDRWNAERNGKSSVGRVLPLEYTYFTGDGKHNHFRNAFKGNYDVWDYSIESPYED